MISRGQKLVKLALQKNVDKDKANISNSLDEKHEQECVFEKMMDIAGDVAVESSSNEGVIVTGVLDVQDVAPEQEVELNLDEDDFSPDESEYHPDTSGSSSSSDMDDNNRLTGMQEFPQVTSKPRRKKRQINQWQRNVRKQRRLNGEDYVSTNGRTIPAASMEAACNVSCRFKCSSAISEQDRNSIFKAYYKLGDYSRQRDFINANTEQLTERITTTVNISKRQFSVKYFLPVNKNKIKVCKTMFLNTVGIKKGVIEYARQKRSSENLAPSDGRGKGRSATLNPLLIERIKKHIMSFPCVPSHYCREGTARKYLDSSLNLATMYRMYQQHCEEENLPSAKLSMYRKLFNDNFNLGFHSPKKDQCRLCVAFENNFYKTEIDVNEHEVHIKKKEEARNDKKKDKEEAAKSGNKIVSCNFDLQQVLLCPCDPTNNALFYKRRLATYNFTVYDVTSKQGNCYIWHEGQGGRGSCEVASLLFHYFKSLPEEVEEVRCFSDRCGGQNLNQYVFAMCMYAVQAIANLKTIHIKFMVTGHSEMECDSMHSAIGTESRRVGKAFWPGDWKTIARGSRKNGHKPYIVHDISPENIIDWKRFVNEYLTIRKADTSKETVLMQKMCWFKFKKESPYRYECKKSFNNETFRTVDCSKRVSRSQLVANIKLHMCYPEGHPITSAKYKDLMSLFLMKPPAMSLDYFDFYSNLPNGKTEEND